MAGTRTIGHRPRRRRRAGAALVLLFAIVAAAAVALSLLVLQAGPSAEDDAGRFLAAWSRGDDRGAAALTDRPQVAAESLAANRRGLDGASLRARLLDVREEATARVPARRSRGKCPGSAASRIPSRWRSGAATTAGR
jgi:hypothetical protein